MKDHDEGQMRCLEYLRSVASSRHPGQLYEPPQLNIKTSVQNGFGRISGHSGNLWIHLEFLILSEFQGRDQPVKWVGSHSASAGVDCNAA